MRQNTTPLVHRLTPVTVSTDDRGRGNFGTAYANKDLQVLISSEISDLDQIPTYHGVHDTGVIDEELRAKLWAKYFGIHWFQEPYTGRWRFEQEQKKFDEDPDRPDRRPLTDWKNCNALATTGGLLTLRDTRFEPDDMRLMRLSLVLPQAITPMSFKHNGETHYLKTLEVHSPASFVVTENDYPELFENIAPRQGSIREWDTHIDVPRRVFKELLEAQ